jgi:ABC-type sugar transport system permease subunit
MNTEVSSRAEPATTRRNSPSASRVGRKVFGRGVFAKPGLATAILLLTPSLILIGAIIAYPMVLGLQYSVSTGSLIKQGGFVGLANYAKLLQSASFYNSLEFSVGFAIANIAGCYTLGLGLALLMQKGIPGQGIFRVLLLLPWIVPSLVGVVSWRWLVGDEAAFVNRIIKWTGGNPIFFLSNSGWTILIVILIKIWRSFPFMMLSLLAALQSIDRTLYEAAAIDGATPRQMFRYITLPQIRNVSIILCLMMIIWSVNDFDTPWLLAQGGPANATQNLVILAYRYTFERNDVGMGAATSFITLFGLMALVSIVLRLQRKR